MGLDFRLGDFAYPFSILKLKRNFDKNEWLNLEALQNYQLQRLKIIIKHAFENIPYYQELFKKIGFTPEDLKNLADLKKIPCLSKEDLRKNFEKLKAKNYQKFHPQIISTSGTTCSQVQFYVDKPSNILEFAFYWRFWGWAGYRLGDRFAELSAQFFTP